MVCIPILLFPKPIIMYFSQKKPEKEIYEEFKDEVIFIFTLRVITMII